MSAVADTRSAELFAGSRGCCLGPRFERWSCREVFSLDKSTGRQRALAGDWLGGVVTGSVFAAVGNVRASMVSVDMSRESDL